MTNINEEIDNAELKDSELQEESNLPVEARRVLVYLLKSSIILQADNQQLFSSLCLYQKEIRSYLRQIYIYLVIDELDGIAFIARTPSEEEVPDEDESGLSLIVPRTLSVLDTLLLLILRKHYQERQTAGEEKVMIEVERIETLLTPFTELVNHASKDRKKIISSLKTFVERKLLLNERNGERYQITALIRYVVNAQFLESMLEEYRQLATSAGGEGDD
ncbi:hypothetical protein AAEX37_01496 [Oligella sp. MSHR50489EDL]|uniref:DUF4194 domain-containing protein n=1 Tax=Oligella sp. MSHR50489EDL TaxID=3139409 RepID=UPI003D81BE73